MRFQFHQQTTMRQGPSPPLRPDFRELLRSPEGRRYLVTRAVAAAKVLSLCVSVLGAGATAVLVQVFAWRRRRHAWFLSGVIYHALRGAIIAAWQRVRRGRPRLPDWSFTFEIANETARSVVLWGQEVLWRYPHFYAVVREIGDTIALPLSSAVCLVHRVKLDEVCIAGVSCQLLSKDSRQEMVMQAHDAVAAQSIQFGEDLHGSVHLGTHTASELDLRRLGYNEQQHQQQQVASEQDDDDRYKAGAATAAAAAAAAAGASLPTGSTPHWLIYFHGGGYASGSPLVSVDVAARLAAAIRKAHDSRPSASETKVRCLLVDYGLAPENIFPKAVDDALAVYEWVAEHYCSSHITVAGDSAGGGLVVSLQMAIKAKNAGACVARKRLGKAVPPSGSGAGSNTSRTASSGGGGGEGRSGAGLVAAAPDPVLLRMPSCAICLSPMLDLRWDDKERPAYPPELEQFDCIQGKLALGCARAYLGGAPAPKSALTGGGTGVTTIGNHPLNVNNDTAVGASSSSSSLARTTTAEDGPMASIREGDADAEGRGEQETKEDRRYRPLYRTLSGGARRMRTDSLEDTNPAVYGDLAGLCPTLVQVGSHEIFLPECESFAQRAADAGSPVRIEVYPYMTHVFQTHAGEKQAEEAVEAVGRFVVEATMAGAAVVR